jgi:glutamyl endopeptidase
MVTLCKHRASYTVLAASLACVLASGQAIAADDDAISDDGEGLGVFAEMSSSAGQPFPGSDELGSSELLLEGATVGELSDAELQELLSLPAVVSPVEDGILEPSEEGAQEIILGFDTRTRNYTLDYPARAVVLITFEAGRCSGFLISPDTVVTAGHCVHPGDGGPFFDRASYEVFPGFDGTTAPYGSCGAARLFTVNGWANNAEERYDYGAVKLDCTIGNTVGWFGFRINARKNTPAIVTGYPGDKPLEQWQSSDKVRRTESRQLFYTADTEGGNSGGPVWEDLWRDNESRGPYAIAVHAYRTHGSGNHALYNHGTRIVSPVFDNFVAWIETPSS